MLLLLLLLKKKMMMTTAMTTMMGVLYILWLAWQAEFWGGVDTSIRKGRCPQGTRPPATRALVWSWERGTAGNILKPFKGVLVKEIFFRWCFSFVPIWFLRTFFCANGHWERLRVPRSRGPVSSCLISYPRNWIGFHLPKAGFLATGNQCVESWSGCKVPRIFHQAFVLSVSDLTFWDINHSWCRRKGCLPKPFSPGDNWRTRSSRGWRLVV